MPLSKETVGMFLNEGSCLLDLSKAFERVKHDILFKNCDIKLVNSLETILTNSTATVNSNNTYSDAWTRRKGVRQDMIWNGFKYS
jgi:hypothetical protein